MELDIPYLRKRNKILRHINRNRLETTNAETIV